MCKSYTRIKRKVSRISNRWLQATFKPSLSSIVIIKISLSFTFYARERDAADALDCFCSTFVFLKMVRGDVSVRRVKSVNSIRSTFLSVVLVYIRMVVRNTYVPTYLSL